MYEMTYRCNNCYSWFFLSVPKKVEAPLYLPCPVCELTTACKTEKSPKDDVYPPSYEYDPRTESIKNQTVRPVA